MCNEICVTYVEEYSMSVWESTQYFLINICRLYWQHFLSTSSFVTAGLAESCCLCVFTLPLADIPTKSTWKDKNKSLAHQIMKQSQHEIKILIHVPGLQELSTDCYSKVKKHNLSSNCYETLLIFLKYLQIFQPFFTIQLISDG